MKSKRYEGFLLDEYGLEPYSIEKDDVKMAKDIFYQKDITDSEKLYYHFIAMNLNNKIFKVILYLYGCLKKGISYEDLQEKGFDSESLKAASLLLQDDGKVRNNELSRNVKIAILQEDKVYYTEEGDLKKVKEIEEKLGYLQERID